MEKGNKVVFGIFRNRNAVENAVSMLRAEDFRHSDISVLMPAIGDEDRFAHEKSTKAPEGAVVGGGIGAVLGGTFGWLAGIGAIAVAPPLGILVAAGPIMAALASAGAVAAIGSATGALVGVGIPEYEAKRYENIIKEGGILLSVHVDDNLWLEKAERILERTGATDISSTREAVSAPWAARNPDVTTETPPFRG